MYYAEKMINGILHYKSTPDGNWKPISSKELSRRVVVAEKLVNRLTLESDSLYETCESLSKNSD